MSTLSDLQHRDIQTHTQSHNTQRHTHFSTSMSRFHCVAMGAMAIHAPTDTVNALRLRINPMSKFF